MPHRTRQIRCIGCGLIPGRCICKELPRVRLPWRVLVLQHRREAHKPTNTARLLARTVENCSIVQVTTRDRSWSPALLGPEDEVRWVLFPSTGAPPVERRHLEEWSQRPTCLILVDGSWRQAGRIVRRATGLADLPHLSLPLGPPSRWPIRRAPRSDQLCTFEALVRLVALQPERAAAHELERAFQIVLAAQHPTRHIDGFRGRADSAELLGREPPRSRVSATP
jgi:DTW domain-containing protein YfiP